MLAAALKTTGGNHSHMAIPNNKQLPEAGPHIKECTVHDLLHRQALPDSITLRVFEAANRQPKAYLASMGTPSQKE